jgi:hypothetical protein
MALSITDPGPTPDNSCPCGIISSVVTTYEWVFVPYGGGDGTGPDSGSWEYVPVTKIVNICNPCASPTSTCACPNELEFPCDPIDCNFQAIAASINYPPECKCTGTCSPSIIFCEDGTTKQCPPACVISCPCDTNTQTQTNTNTSTDSATDTSTDSATDTSTNTGTQTVTNTLTQTQTRTTTNSASQTTTETTSQTQTRTQTQTGTNTRTKTQTQTETKTQSQTTTRTLPCLCPPAQPSQGNSCPEIYTYVCATGLYLACLRFKSDIYCRTNTATDTCIKNCPKGQQVEGSPCTKVCGVDSQGYSIEVDGTWAGYDVTPQDGCPPYTCYLCEADCPPETNTETQTETQTCQYEGDYLTQLASNLKTSCNAGRGGNCYSSDGFATYYAYTDQYIDFNGCPRLNYFCFKTFFYTDPQGNCTQTTQQCDSASF